MSISHLIDPVNTDLQNIYVDTANISELKVDSVDVAGILTAESITVTNPALGGNSVIAVNTQVNTAAVHNFVVGGVLVGSIAVDSDSFTINTNISDPSVNINLLVPQTSSNNKLQTNTSYGYTNYITTPVAGASPLTSNKRAAVLEFAINGGTAPGDSVTVVWNSSLISASSFVRVSPLYYDGAAGSCLVYTSQACVPGAVALGFLNPSLVNTGITVALALLVEIIN